MAFSSWGTGPFSDDLDQRDGGRRFALLAQVRAYWQGLRQDGALTARNTIDPRGIAEALESTSLLERVAKGVARFRIAGMHLHDLIGMDVRGMPLSTLFDPAGRNRLSEGLEAVFTTPAVLEIWLEAERGLGRPRLEGRILVLPLSDAQGQTTLALGCLAMSGALGRAPRRFAITGSLREPISIGAGATAALPDTPDSSATFTPLPSLPKTRLLHLAEGLHLAKGSRRTKPYLRLVYSRD